MSSWHAYFSQWNTILFILGLASLLAIAVFIERLLFFRRSEIDSGSFLIALRQSIENNSIVDAVKICEEAGGAVAHIVKAGLVKYERSKQEIESSMEVVGFTEIAKLERNTKVLSIVAHIAPLIGLLGTVLGFIQAFSEMRRSGMVDISTTRIGEAMEYALVTTAAGLVVAIPSVVGYNYLVSRVKAIVLEIETTSREVVDLLVHQKRNYEI